VSTGFALKEFTDNLSLPAVFDFREFHEMRRKINKLLFIALDKFSNEEKKFV